MKKTSQKNVLQSIVIRETKKFCIDLSLEAIEQIIKQHIRQTLFEQGKIASNDKSEDDYISVDTDEFATDLKFLVRYEK